MDGFAGSHCLIDGQDRPYVGKAFFALCLGRLPRRDVVGRVCNLSCKMVKLIKLCEFFFPVRSDLQTGCEVESECGVIDQFAGRTDDPDRVRDSRAKRAEEMRQTFTGELQRHGQAAINLSIALGRPKPQ